MSARVTVFGAGATGMRIVAMLAADEHVNTVEVRHNGRGHPQLPVGLPAKNVTVSGRHPYR